MPALLFCKTGQLAGASYEIGDSVQIGKNPDNTIQLHPAPISGRHARIFFDQQKQSYYIEDLGSRNGTRLDGMSVRGREKLDRLNIITFANSFDFIFQVVEAGHAVKKPRDVKTSAHSEGFAAPPVGTPEKAKTQYDGAAFSDPFKGKKEDGGKTMLGDEPGKMPSFEKKPAAAEGGKTMLGSEPGQLPKFESKGDKGEGGKTMLGDAAGQMPSFEKKKGDPGKTSIEQGGFIPPQIAREPSKGSKTYTLELKDPSGGATVFTLKEGENVLGRISSCDIHVDDPSVSRNHASFKVAGDTVTVRDLGSKNHTYVDGKRITAEMTLADKTKLRFGLVDGTIVVKKS
jgi:pSer/pThr/pTyr-binding forkhead associated (FHA) protein